MRRLLFAATIICLSASGAMAQYRNCAAAYPNISRAAGLRERLACVQANEDELRATLAALMNNVEIRSVVGGDMAYGNPWCLMIKAGANATVARNCAVLPGEFGSVKWQLVPAQ